LLAYMVYFDEDNFKRKKTCWFNSFCDDWFSKLI
jgi:hypothetical protein